MAMLSGLIAGQSGSDENTRLVIIMYLGQTHAVTQTDPVFDKCELTSDGIMTD